MSISFVLMMFLDKLKRGIDEIRNKDIFFKLIRTFARNLKSLMVYLTRIEKFNAAHKLWVKEWSEEKNFQVFGKCSNKNWHGHNYKLYITVAGDPDPITGFVIDAKQLSKIIRKHVTDKLDHSNLNLDVDFIPDDKLPTTENLVILIWNELKPHLDSCTLHCVKLVETETIYAEYFGENK